MNNTLGFLSKGIVVKVTAAGSPQTDGSQQTDRAKLLIQVRRTSSHANLGSTSLNFGDAAAAAAEGA